jgi:WD40 repeat protein
MTDKITRDNAGRISETARFACGFPSQVAWSPDGELLAAAHGGGIGLWQPDAPLPYAHIAHDSPIKGLAFDSTGGWIVCGGSDTLVRGLLVETREIRWDFAAGAAVNTVAVRGDDQWIAAGAGDGNLFLWERGTARPVRQQAHQDEITQIAFLPDGRLITGGWDGMLAVWTPGRAGPDAWVKRDDADGKPVWVRGVAASSLGIVAACYRDGQVWLMRFGASETHQVAALTAHEGGCDAAAFSPDGALLVTGGRDHDIIVWETKSFTALHTLRAHTRPVLDLAFSPDGRAFVSAGGDGTLRVWRVAP